MIILVYLNDVDEGGEMCFEYLGIEVASKKGKALVFFSSFVACMLDVWILYIVMFVKEGYEKWVF